MSNQEAKIKFEKEEVPTFDCEIWLEKVLEHLNERQAHECIHQEKEA